MDDDIVLGVTYDPIYLTEDPNDIFYTETGVLCSSETLMEKMESGGTYQMSLFFVLQYNTNQYTRILVFNKAITDISQNTLFTDVGFSCQVYITGAREITLFGMVGSLVTNSEQYPMQDWLTITFVDGSKITYEFKGFALPGIICKITPSISYNDNGNPVYGWRNGAFGQIHQKTQMSQNVASSLEGVFYDEYAPVLNTMHVNLYNPVSGYDGGVMFDNCIIATDTGFPTKMDLDHKTNAGYFVYTGASQILQLFKENASLGNSMYIALLFSRYSIY